MRQSSRLVVCFVALSLASCSSQNKGKIVGKWRAVAAPNSPPAAETPQVEFTADSRVVFSAIAPDGSGTEKTKGKYSLGAGELVTLTNLEPSMGGNATARCKITIADDSLTIHGDPKEPALVFKRVP